MPDGRRRELTDPAEPLRSGTPGIANWGASGGQDPARLAKRSAADIRNFRYAAVSDELEISGDLERPLDPELAAEIPSFEQFFKTFGFKRVQGRVWGLLVLSDRPLASKEICEQLEISQAAASTTLNDLAEWGAITSTFDSHRRCHLHAPVGNALTIAATILRRREQVAFEQFRHTADRALAFIQKRYSDRDPRVLTLRSIISACEIAEAVMSLLVGAVANALGDPQSILSRAINAAVKVGFSGMHDMREIERTVREAPRVEQGVLPNAAPQQTTPGMGPPTVGTPTPEETTIETSNAEGLADRG